MKIVLVTKQFDGSGMATWPNTAEKLIVAYNKKEAKLETDEEKKDYMQVGKGIYEKFPLDKIMERRKDFKDWIFLFDTNNSWKEADQLRAEGFKVFGSGKFNWMLEDNRQFAIKFAEKCGLQSPMWEEFKSVADGIKFLQANPDKAFVFKPNGGDSHLTKVIKDFDPQKNNEKMQKLILGLGINDFILQEKKLGIEVNVEAFMVNGKPVCADVLLENKRKGNNDRGSMIGCSGDIVFDVPLTAPIIAKTVGKYFPLLEKMNYTGFADINCIISDDQVWFLENCMRIGYNIHPNYFSTISRKDIFTTVSEMIDGTFVPDVRAGFGASITMTTDCPHMGLPINFPQRLLKNIYLFGAYKNKDEYFESGYFKEIAVVTGYGYTIKDAVDDALFNVDRVDFADSDWRDDLGKDCYFNAPIKRFEALKCLKLL